MRHLPTAHRRTASTLILLSVFFCIGAYGRTPTQEPVWVRLSVSPQQEQNFNAFMAWFTTHELFKENEGLGNNLRAVFEALKSNKYAEYIPRLKKLEEDLEKLSQTEKEAILQFLRTLSIETRPQQIQPLEAPGGSCWVVCLFGSCGISCAEGTRPLCYCTLGLFPHCECEI